MSAGELLSKYQGICLIVGSCGLTAQNGWAASVSLGRHARQANKLKVRMFGCPD